MRIREFKKGDVIHRTKPFRATYGEDGSFIETPMEFLGVKSGLIFYMDLECSGIAKNHIHNTRLHNKDDDGWDYYPSEFLNTKKDNEK